MLINPFRSALTENDLLDGDVNVIAGKYIELGRKTIDAGTAMAIGYGILQGQQSAEGRVYMDFQNATPAAVDGKVRLVLEDPQKRPVEILFEARTEQLRTSVSDRRQQLPLPEHPAKCGEDWSIVLQFMADANDTISKANSTIFLDVTNYTDR